MKMRNKIPCSAERLGLLDPQMIQGVSEASAFHIGHQYLTENRVRIVEADDSQISSAVIGNSGLYEQTIRLKDGHLISKCSCTLQEEPLCRHCIAVLLEYHRWAQPRQSRKPTASRENKTQPQTDSSIDGNGAATSSSAPDVKLAEIMLFVEWLQPAMHAVEKAERIPEPPVLGPGPVSLWIQAIRNLEDRRRESEEIQLNLESELRDREAYAGRLTQQLQSSVAEAKASQATSQELQREVTAYKAILTRVTELAGDISRFDGQVRSLAGDILDKGTQLEKLTGSFKEVVETLKSTIKQKPSP